ncbi:MAG TPA: accessory gene regulator B family protein [Firmicutes bacterium]|jgi:accessory gene regulator protein AgrB|nr:accessory gene regulator B family protein [Bacillota bacterium]HOQ25075.1 accessory gene regulator B family protein [Bacillota bacterium]HPT68424.1 accessory gene regulator B family protein [Bacillota bacterium]
MLKTINNIADFLERELALSADKKEILVYSLQILFLFCGTFLGILSVAFLVSRLWQDIFSEAIIASLTMASYRFVSGGFHFKNFILCMIISSLIPAGIAVLAVILVQQGLNLPTPGWWLAWLLMLGIAVFFAPRPVEERPIGKKEAKKFKCLSIVMLTCWGIIINLLPPAIALSVLIGLGIQTASIITGHAEGK